ncbi:hypothetical protein, partial [Desulfosarcina sp.]|uniref:hypothetical protein n=1 Tax=Desulfosarcina sp. TaxID=2027861 RepID=UPI0029A8B3AA
HFSCALFLPNPDKLEITNYKNRIQINPKLQYPNLKQDTDQQLSAIIDSCHCIGNGLTKKLSALANQNVHASRSLGLEFWSL